MVLHRSYPSGVWAVRPASIGSRGGFGRPDFVWSGGGAALGCSRYGGASRVFDGGPQLLGRGEFGRQDVLLLLAALVAVDLPPLGGVRVGGAARVFDGGAQVPGRGECARQDVLLVLAALVAADLQSHSGGAHAARRYRWKTTRVRLVSVS